MQNPIQVGSAWDCPQCGAPGPLLTGPCTNCGADLPAVLLAGYRTGAILYSEALRTAAAGFYSEAASLLEQALDTAGPDPGALALTGLLYHNAGRVAEAQAAWQQAGEVAAAWAADYRPQPDEIEALRVYNRGLSLAASGRWEESFAVLEGLMAGRSRLPQAHLLLGMAAWSTGRFDVAQRAWQRTIDLDPSTPGLQTCLVALVERLLVESERRGIAPVGTPVPDPDAEAGPGLTPTTRSGPGRWIPVALALLIALGSGAGAYSYAQRRAADAQRQSNETTQASQQAVEQARAAQQRSEQEAIRSAEAAKAGRDAQAQAESRARDAESAAAASRARETAATALLAAGPPGDRAEDLERLIAATDAARMVGLAIPDWIERSLGANRVQAAVERYFQGYRAWLADDYELAISLFEASVKLNAQVFTADDAAYLAARSAQISGQHALAVTWYNRVLTDFPDSLYQDDALFFGARAAQAAGEKERALRWYRELLDRFPRSGYDDEAIRELSR